MKYVLSVLLVVIAFASCESNKKVITNTTPTSNRATDTIRIANDSLEYEIIIMEQGFDRYLNTQPPEDFYGITFLENKNYLYVTAYNRNVMDITYSRDLFPQQINYDTNKRYGQEVNYLLYMYFQFFEEKYNQRLK